MTIKEKVKNMQGKMAQMRDDAKTDDKRACFELLHDTVKNTWHRIDDMDDYSMIGYIELAAIAVCSNFINLSELRNNLTKLGFSTGLSN